MPKTAYYHNIFLRIIKCYIERKMEQGAYCAAHRAALVRVLVRLFCGKTAAKIRLK